MSNHLDPYFTTDGIANLPKATAQTVVTRITDAIERMQLAASNYYESISVFSIFWESDDTGGKEDSELFIHTLSESNLQNVQTFQRSLSNKVNQFTVFNEIQEAVSQSNGNRKLLIFHYAGHAFAGSTADTLIITPKIGQELGDGPQVNMLWIKNSLKEMCSTFLGLDILLIMDSCCAAIIGRGGKIKGARVELMAATARKGISNSRQDGQTFTQHWCEAFTKLLKIGKPFGCDDILNEITPHPELEQFPSTFILREGWNVPITFQLHPSPVKSTLPSALTSQMVITAFHVEENPDSPPIMELLDYLKGASIPITVLAVVPTASTFLLLCIPVVLQELLVLPRIALAMLTA